jgi:hypothetical protein
VAAGKRVDVDAYKKRLERDKKGTGKRLFDENFGLVKTIGTSLFSIGGQGLGLEVAHHTSGSDLQTNWDPSANIKQIHENLGQVAKDDGTWLGADDRANVIVNFTGQALGFMTDTVYEGGVEIGEAVGESRERARELPERAKIAAKLAAAIAGAVAAQLGKPFEGTGLGVEVSSTFGTIVDRNGIAALLSAESFAAKDATAIAALLGTASKQALLKLDPAHLDSTRLFSAAANAVESLFSGAPAAATVPTVFVVDPPDSAIAASFPGHPRRT